ncbi:MAG: AAA family ATPase [Bacteroidales bacterium]|nr:AAA family ATPase [Bacteroidales bacterium]
MNKNSQNMETKNENANPQLASENNLINNLGGQLLSEIMVKETKNETTDEVKATDVKVYSKNAFQSSLAHEFEKLKQKVVEQLPPALEIQDYSIPNANGMELLNDEVEEIPKLIDPIFHRVGLASLIGSSDTGKSSCLRDLCVHIVTGMDFLGWKVNPIHKRAYYVSTEDDQMAISFLLKKQNKDYGLIPEDLENLVYIFETDNLVDRLNKELSEKPADVVVIDAFADVFNGQLYETNRVRAFLNEFSQLAQKHQCLIIFLHHTNKRSDNLEPSKHNALGSQGFEAKMRLMIELKSDTQVNNQKHFCIVKGNYLSNQFKTHSFDLQFTENLTFKNLNTRTHYELMNKDKDNIELIEAEYNEIMTLKQENLTHEEIGLRLGVSKSSISRKISRYKRLKALEDSNQK